VIARYRDLDIPKFFRGDAAFAGPKLLRLLEQVRLPPVDDLKALDEPAALPRAAPAERSRRGGAHQAVAVHLLVQRHAADAEFAGGT
jgi:hypothetical protein